MMVDFRGGWGHFKVYFIRIYSMKTSWNKRMGVIFLKLSLLSIDSNNGFLCFIETGKTCMG